MLTDCRAQAYNFQKLSIQEGLPQSQAYAILFDSTQHAWIGTQGGGLCRYNGFEFDYYTKNDSLISNRIFTLKEIRNEIWVGQKGGVSVFNVQGLFVRNYQFENPSIIVQDIVLFMDDIYVATDFGLFLVENAALIEQSSNVTLKGLSINSFFVSENNLWCCTNQGLLNFRDPLRKINAAKGLSNDQINCAVELNGNWILGTYGDGINIYNPRSGELNKNPTQELKNKVILTLYVDSNKDLWIGTLNNGLYLFSQKDGTLKNYQTSNGLSNNHVKCIASDYWENVWIGTSGGGVSIFQNSPFVAYYTSSGLNANYVYAVLNTKKNDIWVATEGTGVVRINDTSAVTFDEEYGFSSAKVKALFEDANGDIWIGTEGSGLGVFSQYDGKDTIYSFSSVKGMTSEWVRCFAQDGKNGPIYIGTGGGGVMKVQKTWEFPLSIEFKNVRPKNIDFPARINSLDFIEGQLWFTSSENNYGYYSSDKLKLLASESSFRNCVGQYNKRWLGSADNGILQLTLEGDSIADQDWISVDHGLSSNNIYQLILNGFDLWVGTEKGLDRVRLDSNYAIQSIEHFGKEEGFEGVETNINAGYLDSYGNLWFGSVNGLYLYQGGEVNYQQRKSPVLSLNDFSIFYESIEKTDYAEYFENGKMLKNLVLPYDMNHIGFSFQAIHYTYAKNIKYRWKLSGADPDWTPPSNITTATYSNLPPGKYTFQVKASIDDNWEDDKAIELKFQIDDPYYDKFWFKAGYYFLIGLVLLVIVLVIRYRIRRKNKMIREKFELEKNLIELEQKALRLQMNPHFIFNVLTSIHNLIILNDSDKARYALSKFSKLMRRVLENSREKFISIDDEIETLENYVQLEKLTANLDVELDLQIDENIDAAEALLPPLMIQPFVENAIIHGLKDIDRPGIIKVGFKLINEHLLECFVEDNGRGRISAAEINSQREDYHKSTALEVTQERLANLNKDVAFVPFEIIDLKTDEGKPCGTKVIFRLLI